MKSYSLVLFIFSIAVSACQRGSDAPEILIPAPLPQCGMSPTNYIVKMKPSVGALSLLDKMSGFQKRFGFENKIKSLGDQFLVVNFKDASNAREKIREMIHAREIEYAEPDQKVFALDTPNDPMFQKQWAHQMIQSSGAWDITHGNKSVVVALIDTGVDYTHPDLQANMWINPGEISGNGIDDDKNGYVDDIYGYDFANNDSNPMADDSGTFHGTHTSGIVGAVGGNAVGVVGASPVVKIMALKFLSANGGGELSSAIRAIDYAIKNGAKILNNSWGSEQSSRALGEAVARAQQAGILFVAASGNGGYDGVGDNNDVSPSFPANYQIDNVISVASTSENDLLSRFSNYGVNSVHIAAPGQDILSTMNGGRYQTMSGTSMSSPLVAGVLALMMAERPDLDYREIKQVLLNNVDLLPGLSGKISSGGRVNAYKAIKALSDGTPIPSPAPTPVPTPEPPPEEAGDNTPASCL